MQITELTADLAKHEEARDYLAVIQGVRGLVSVNPQSVKDPWIKGWIGRPLEVPNVQFMDAVRLSSYDANNDMQLTQKQSLVPIGMNTHVAMAHAHHWDVAYAPFPLAMRAASPNLDHWWPRYAALVACWELLAELGLID
jgi:hypothetical protein